MLRHRKKIGGLAIVLLGLAACTKPTPSPSSLRSAAPGIDWGNAQSLTVKLDDFDFMPARLTFRAGAPVRLILTNVGTGEHDFSAPGFFGQAAFRSGGALPRRGGVEVAKNQTVEIDLVPGAAGTYPLECTEFLHAMFGMTGTIDVTAAPN